MTQIASPHAVLVIDDNQKLCKGLARILKLDGYRVDIANSASAALDREEWQHYFAILVDRKLPDSTLTELLPQIIAQAPEAAVMVITGYADLESSLQAIRLGASDYLLKPIDPDQLRARLRRFVELREARDEVRMRDEQVQFMVDNLPAGAAYVDLKSNLVRVNRRVEELTGYSDAELSDRDAWFRILFGERKDEYQAAYENARTTGLSQPWLVDLVTKNGRKMIVEFSGYRYDNHEVWLINDVTERQQYEEQVRKQRDFSDRILETAQVIILILDREGKIVRFNKFMEVVSGFQLEEVRDQNWFELFIPDSSEEQIRESFDRVILGAEIEGNVNPIRTKSGLLRQIAWWGKPLRDADGEITAVLSIGHDVTDLMNIKSQLVQSERLAAIGEMITGLAHESRNALQRARACLDMLSLDLVEQPAHMDLTHRIKEALNELQRLYEEVRGYAAPIQLSLGPCRLKDIWEAAWQHITEAMEDRPIVLQAHDDLPEILCVVDRLRIEQVFRNVLENAAAASPPESVVTLKSEACEYKNAPAIRVQISDNGPGIEHQDPNHIFEPFYTTKQKGTGLGMPISKRIVEAHHGEIYVAANTSKGATIEIVLPCKQPNPY
ncbi:PAS domain S-box protein [Thalassoglobus polymorphus]|uniref:histidine kinase n=1 Tax=Thalassoglobus polymorphus TaxID=2527994 RepID=A0A517QJM2_9PLAN|nr:PAS domain S-box protein [Thalassoglobus polymorphus]QDT31842.1 Sporulation kinase E [Thalassoglobus polymorphus]